MANFQWFKDLERLCPMCKKIKQDSYMKETELWGTGYGYFTCRVCGYKLKFKRILRCPECAGGLLKLRGRGYLPSKENPIQYFYKCDMCDVRKVYEENLNELET